MSTPGTLAWFAAHESRVAWREWLAMMTAGRRWKLRSVILALGIFAVFMHVMANLMVRQYASITADASLQKDVLIGISGMILLSGCLVLSQAMESVTRAFYARADLDLILSSPIKTRRIFAVRLATVATSVALTAALVAAPFINVLAIRGGPHWLAAYAVVIAIGAIAAALATAIVVALFRSVGARRTRFISQVLAAVIGAAFVIGLQVAAILSYGTLSRLAVLQSDSFITNAPDAASPIWLPARAVLGDPTALAAVLLASFLALVLSIAVFSRRFGEHAVAAAGAAQGGGVRRGTFSQFRTRSPRSLLRRKEWTLLRRDPWLVSQTLMQVLYLLPPALLLWLSYREGTSPLLVLIPVLVMVAGQLAGGLAWIAISGEDAPELVATAPVTPGLVIRAKFEAVLGAIGVVFAPFVLAVAGFSPWHGLLTVVGIVISAMSTTLIQLWFRSQAKRSHFRRRQTSSRVATFAEAFSSISWAAAAAMISNGSFVLAMFPALVACAVLLVARQMAPR